MAAVADEPAATQRSLAFLGGPLLLLAGLHARLFGFLHAPDRARWLPLPIVPERHFAAALSSHRPAFWWTVALGIAALLLAAPDGTTASGIPARLGLASGFVWLSLMAVALEPFVAGVSAEFGRRFPPETRAHELQRSLGGGWTTAEAVVHLYAPAFGIALAVLLAMPGQLSWEHYLDHGVLNTRQVGIGAAPLLVALGLRLMAIRLYRRGVWEAVPWLVEATRTLAGPPQPEPTPVWARRVRDPWTRLLVIQFWRVTPLPGLRLALLLAVTAFVPPSSGPAIALWLAAIGAWVVPAGTLARDRVARARLAGALPLHQSRRSGRPGVLVVVALLAPVVLSGTVLAGRMLLDPHPASGESITK
jgi:type IV secretory pathway VirB2 component (pilin)